ncbi:MAG TPA: septal ring lytic transglycosylase RlpA family protein [Terriglobia bacterium]|nr:septal ring lytic transglycosylase RlpA family protein [Terriglobia bacterium]
MLLLPLLALGAGLVACGPKTVRASTPVRTPARSVPAAAAPAPSDLVGLATYYAEPYNGRPTASGEIFDSYNAMTAAHRTLPFDTIVRVVNQKNGLEVDVRINDRGPFVDGRIIDLSLAAARKIDMVRDGVVPVELKVLGVESKASRARFAVQVAAPETPEEAQALRSELEKRYREVTIERVELDKTYYRVRIPQNDEESARRVINELRKEDFQPYMVRLQ